MVNQDLVNEYVQATGKNPPNVKKNDEGWMTDRITDAKENPTSIITDGVEVQQVQQAQVQKATKKIDAHVKVAGKLEQIEGKFLFGKDVKEEWLIKLGTQEKLGITIPEQDPQNPVHWAKVPIGNEKIGFSTFFIAREKHVLIPKSLWEQAMNAHVKKGRPHPLLKRSLPSELR